MLSVTAERVYCDCRTDIILDLVSGTAKQIFVPAAAVLALFPLYYCWGSHYHYHRASFRPFLERVLSPRSGRKIPPFADDQALSTATRQILAIRPDLAVLSLGYAPCIWSIGDPLYIASMANSGLATISMRPNCTFATLMGDGDTEIRSVGATTSARLKEGKSGDSLSLSELLAWRP